jgi:transposase
MTVPRRHELSDAQWARLAPLLAAARPKVGNVGRPAHDHRRVLNGLLWRIRTGAPWRDVPERYGPWSTLYSRFRRWRRAGVWDRLFAAAQRAGDAAGELDWTLHFVDGTVVRAHQPAAGAKGGRRKRRRSATAGAASRPRSTSGWRAGASPWCSS